MSTTPSSIHGYEVRSFLRMLGSETDLELNDEIRLLNGMSNLNLLVKSSNQCYVVKVPGLRIDYEENPYNCQYAVQKIAHRHQLSSRPIAKGKLNGELPFFVSEYEDGMIKADSSSFTREEIAAIRQVLSKFSDLHLPVPKYGHPLDYLKMNRKRISHIERNAMNRSTLLPKYIETMNNLGNKLEGILAGMPSWCDDSMHGDFRPSNVILQNDSVLLIDFEHSCEGSLLYDIAYFFAEPMGAFEIPIENPFVETKEKLREITRLVPLALYACLTWTVLRLAHLEMGVVEKNLVSPEIQNRIELYFRQKSEQLDRVLEKPT